MRVPRPRAPSEKLTVRRLKASGEQLDDRIVEVHWDAELNAWRMMRFRTDKPHGNHKSVVDAIIKSIADGVEKEQVRTARRVPALTRSRPRP